MFEDRDVIVVAGSRTPFVKAGTLLGGVHPVDLGRIVVREAVERADIDPADVDEVIGPMLDAWRDGDESGLEDSLDEDFEGYAELAELLIFERNRNWDDQVSEMLEGSEDVLLVVGAMHLVGPRGLPALLEKRGYRVERR